MEVRRLCARKEEIYGKLLGNHKPPVVPGVPMFLETLVKHNVRPRPAVLCSNRTMCFPSISSVQTCAIASAESLLREA